MARKFVKASTQYLSLARAIVTAPPFSMACWFNVTDAVTEYVLMNLGNAGSHQNRFALVAAGDLGGVLVNSRTSTNAQAVSTINFVGNVWNHAAGVWTSSTSRDAYLNGSNKGSNATSKVPSTPNETDIGRYGDNTFLCNGLIAEAAIWNAALTDGEVLALGRRTRPIFIRPMSLVAYWPLRKPGSVEYDAFHTVQNNLLVTGALSVPYNPPAVFYPRKRKRYPGSAADVLMGAMVM